MMGQLPPDQNALFYDFCLEHYVPQDHLLRQIDPFLDLSSLRNHLSDFYSNTGRPSVDLTSPGRLRTTVICAQQANRCNVTGAI